MIMELLDDENDHNSQVEKLKEILFKEGDDGLDDILSKVNLESNNNNVNTCFFFSIIIYIYLSNSSVVLINFESNRFE